MLYIGIDLGTSAVKLLLMDGEGAIQNIVSKEYPLEFPRPGWSQQNPEDWKRLCWKESLSCFPGLMPVRWQGLELAARCMVW